jgi:hypothetical protein
MEGIVNKFVNKYNQDADPHEVRITNFHFIQADEKYFQKIKVVKSGPAMTLWIGKLSIDIVPVFAFSCEPPRPIKTPRPLNRVYGISI